MADIGITADQCRIGRAAIGWSEDDLATAAGVAVGDIIALETGALASALVSGKILEALSAAGVSFFEGPDGRARMRARTLDGIVEAPVTMAPRS